MTLKNLFPLVCTVLDEEIVGEDRYHNETKAFATAGDFACRLEVWRGREYEIDRDTRVTFYKVFIEPTVYGLISSTSIVVINDVMYSVYADPHVYWGRSVVNHVECILRSIEA